MNDFLISLFIFFTGLSTFGFVTFFLSYLVSHLFTGGSMFFYSMTGKFFDYLVGSTTLLAMALAWSKLA